MVIITSKVKFASLFNIHIYKARSGKGFKRVARFDLAIGNGILETMLNWINRILNRRHFVYKLILIKLCATNTKVKLPLFVLKR